MIGGASLVDQTKPLYPPAHSSKTTTTKATTTKAKDTAKATKTNTTKAKKKVENNTTTTKALGWCPFWAGCWPAEVGYE